MAKREQRMANERSQRVERLFEAAVALAPEDRPIFLSRQCHGDEALLREMQRLLENDSRAGDEFLRPPPPDPRLAQVVPSDQWTLSPGTRIGSCVIQSQIAQGGMGTVYLAEQEKPRRPVALKLLHSAFWSKSAERRFDAESHILGYLRHPNIAQVYEAGSHRLESGALIHYFVMEYVPDASPITKYAGGRSLLLKARLELFLQLCEAVHHGHQKGVIHRDLKPANVLVDREGHVKVIDFGIARTLDSDIAATTMHTETGQILGTLAYMSPEQCEADPGRIDTTTDIYSLGVILYELLTGRMPYDVSNMTIHSAARVICEKEPKRPSEFGRHLRGDIETIVLKAIEKACATRYQSVADLAADIRHCLKREPISARPPTPWTSALRWAARHPLATTMIACAVVGVFMLASVGVTYWLLVHRPDRLEVENGNHRVVVYSWGNLRLGGWEDTDRGGRYSAVAIDRPAALGGDRIAVLGVAVNSSNSLPGGAYAFSLNGPYDEPLWSAHISDSDLPDELRTHGLVGKDFGPFFVSHYDVFPDNPGDEIVTVFLCHFSQRALCIYSLDGTLLYRVWQDGGVESTYWLADAGLLICAGYDEAIKVAAQREGNYELPLCHTVFAVKPTKGLIRRDYLKPDAADPALRPVWYKYVWPLASRSLMFSVDTSAPLRAEDRGRFAKLSTEFNGRAGSGFSFNIDSRGREVAQSRITGDSYRADQAQPANLRKLPPPEMFQLRDEPPTDSWTPPAQPSQMTTSRPALAS